MAEPMFKKGQEIMMLGMLETGIIDECVPINEDIIAYKIINVPSRPGETLLWPEPYAVEKEEYDSLMIMAELTGKTLYEVLRWKKKPFW
mgnify:CR=1 FL=1